MFFTVALAHVEFCWVNTFMSLIVQTTYSTINHLLQTKKPHAYMFPLSCVTTSHTICRTKTKLKTLAKMYNLIGIVQVRVAWYIFCWSTLLFILRLFADFFFVVSILAFCSFLRYIYSTNTRHLDKNKNKSIHLKFSCFIFYLKSENNTRMPNTAY